MTTPLAPRGYPYGDWYLYTMDENGNWGHVAKFALDKTMTQGKTVKVRLSLDHPTTFKAVTITSVESGMDFTLWRFIDFYVDPSCLPEGARNAVAPELEEQFAAYAGKQPPLTRQTVTYQAYSNPEGNDFYFDPPNDYGRDWDYGNYYYDQSNDYGRWDNNNYYPAATGDYGYGYG